MKILHPSHDESASSESASVAGASSVATVCTNYGFFPKSPLDHVAKPYKFLQNDTNSPSKKKSIVENLQRMGPKTWAKIKSPEMEC